MLTGADKRSQEPSGLEPRGLFAGHGQTWNICGLPLVGTAVNICTFCREPG